MKPNSPLFSGSIVALVTPMLTDGTVDLVGLKRLIEWHIVSGSHGLVVMGSTGEAATLTFKEHALILETALQVSDGRIPIIAGCSSASTQTAIDLVKSLNGLKPNGFLCVTPYYVKALQEGLYQHYSRVAEACEQPLLLYNVPSRTACDLENETVIRLANTQNIVGIKDAVGDIPRSIELIDALGHEFCLLSGDDPTAWEFMQAGGAGVITVSGNIAPKAMSDWCAMSLAGDHKGAKVIFDKLNSLHDVMFVESNPIPAKWALFQMKKIDCGIRLPLTLPSSAARASIESLLKTLGGISVV